MEPDNNESDIDDDMTIILKNLSSLHESISSELKSLLKKCKAPQKILDDLRAELENTDPEKKAEKAESLAIELKILQLDLEDSEIKLKQLFQKQNDQMSDFKDSTFLKPEIIKSKKDIKNAGDLLYDPENLIKTPAPKFLSEEMKEKWQALKKHFKAKIKSKEEITPALYIPKRRDLLTFFTKLEAKIQKDTATEVTSKAYQTTLSNIHKKINEIKQEQKDIQELLTNMKEEVKETILEMKELENTERKKLLEPLKEAKKRLVKFQGDLWGKMSSHKERSNNLIKFLLHYIKTVFSSKKYQLKINNIEKKLRKGEENSLGWLKKTSKKAEEKIDKEDIKTNISNLI